MDKPSAVATPPATIRAKIADANFILIKSILLGLIGTEQKLL